MSEDKSTRAVENSLRLQIQALQQHNDKLKEQVHDIRDKRDALIVKLEKAAEEIKVLENKSSEAQDRLTDAEDKITYLRGVVKGLKIALGESG